jgi:hypothetical protein
LLGRLGAGVRKLDREGCTSSKTKRNWGWDIALNRAGYFEEADTVDHVKVRTKNRGDKTIMQLGIAPETIFKLHWDEEEENFETALNYAL